MELKEILSILIRWLIPFICCGFITWINTYHGKNKAMREGVRSLLRAEIIRAYEKYTERGYCPIYAREPLTKVYEAYHHGRQRDGHGLLPKDHCSAVRAKVRCGICGFPRRSLSRCL